MLFGVEDRINQKLPKRLTQTFGQDWNDALYALSKIESRFRADSKIEHGNTLVEDKFYNEEFDVVVANPPYGVSWKGYQSDIQNDKTERFKYLPSISDGQLLFMQHLISKLDGVGMGVVVHNGSTLFSGDAGSSESNIRKWMLDTDIVEAIIQLPTDEFFNTGIYTYLWVLNKNKSTERIDKLMLINASDKFKPLKKSKGSKRKEVDEENRLLIVETLSAFQDNDFAKVFDKEYFYFNKQAIMLTNIDEDGNSYEQQLEEGKKSTKLVPINITNGENEITEFTITKYDEKEFNSLKDYHEQAIKPLIVSFDYKEQPLTVTTEDAAYYFDNDKETLIKMLGELVEPMGCGKIVIKPTYKKGTNTNPEQIDITVELTPDYQKDYEIIQFHKNEEANKKAISDFMTKYITKPFEYLENVVGVEINFNKVYYKPEKLREVTEILLAIEDLDNKLKDLEAELGL
jgi:type I restriction enzyme M protein